MISESPRLVAENMPPHVAAFFRQLCQSNSLTYALLLECVYEYMQDEAHTQKLLEDGLNVWNWNLLNRLSRKPKHFIFKYGNGWIVMPNGNGNGHEGAHEQGTVGTSD